MTVIQTKRLALRRFVLDDAAFILELLNDPSWVRYIGDRGLRSTADAIQWIETSLLDSYRRHGYGFWAVQLTNDPRPLGLCGLIKRDTLPDIDVGYAFLPAYRGHGYAREAARACIEHAFRVLGHRRVLAITSPDNLASQQVLAAIGMRLHEHRQALAEQRETLVYCWDAAVENL